MASVKRNLSLLEEEKLVEMVRHYQILSDKSHNGYKERDAAWNAWSEVAMVLDLLPDGESARQVLKVLRRDICQRKIFSRNSINLAYHLRQYKRPNKTSSPMHFSLGLTFF